MPHISVKREIIQFVRWSQPLVLFFITFKIIDDKKTCYGAILGLMILMLVTSSATPLTSSGIFKIGKSYFAGGPRASGFFEVNAFAAYLALFIPLVFTFMLFQKNYALRTLNAILLLVSLIALITTGSRGGILSLLGGISVYLTTLYRQKVIRLLTLLQILTALTIFSVISFVLAPTMAKTTVIQRFDPSKSESIETYSSQRINIWLRSIQLFVERPIFGHGQNTIQSLMELRLWGKKRVAHNQYLNYLVEFGIIGCAFFILLLLKLFQVMWFYQKTTPDRWSKMLLLSYVSGLTGYTISMLFMNNLGPPRFIFWFYTAVLLKYGQLSETGHS
jgi:O-antigen ligase